MWSTCVLHSDLLMFIPHSKQLFPHRIHQEASELWVHSMSRPGPGECVPPGQGCGFTHTSEAETTQMPTRASGRARSRGKAEPGEEHPASFREPRCGETQRIGSEKHRSARHSHPRGSGALKGGEKPGSSQLRAQPTRATLPLGEAASRRGLPLVATCLLPPGARGETRGGAARRARGTQVRPRASLRERRPGAPPRAALIGRGRGRGRRRSAGLAPRGSAPGSSAAPRGTRAQLPAARRPPARPTGAGREDAAERVGAVPCPAHPASAPAMVRGRAGLCIPERALPHGREPAAGDGTRAPGKRGRLSSQRPVREGF